MTRAFVARKARGMTNTLTENSHSRGIKFKFLAKFAALVKKKALLILSLRLTISFVDVATVGKPYPAISTF